MSVPQHIVLLSLLASRETFPEDRKPPRPEAGVAVSSRNSERVECSRPREQNLMCYNGSWVDNIKE